MINALIKEGAHIKAYDPEANDNMNQLFKDLHTCSTWEEAGQDADGVVIMTEWNEFRGLDLLKLKRLKKNANLLDCRNLLKIDDLKSLGFNYDNVGRKKA